MSLGAALDVQNTDDTASNQVLILKSADRATPTANDEGYISLYNDDSNGNQVEFSRIAWVASDVTYTTKDSRIEFGVMSDNTLTEVMQIDNTGLALNTLSVSGTPAVFFYFSVINPQSVVSGSGSRRRS